MRLVKPSMYDLLYLANEARPDEREQWEALTGRAWDVDDVANDHFNRPGVQFVLLVDGRSEPIVAGGWDEIIPGVWQSWMIGTMPNWERHWRSITKASRATMDTLLDNGARRLQTVALASRARACEWYVRGLKMRLEGPLRCFGMAGQDAVMYSRIKEPCGG